MKTRALIAVIACAVSLETFGQGVRKAIRTEQKFTIVPGGTFVLENPLGNIEIVAADVIEVEATIATTINAADDAALQEARKQSGYTEGGDTKTRVIRATVVQNPNRKAWSVISHWTVRVPRLTNVRVISNTSGRIRIAGVLGHVHVKNFNGNVQLDNTSGATFIESVNGSIVYGTPHPRGNVVLSTVNGHITASVAPDGDYRWIAETAMGDIRTNLPARGAFFGTTFRGSVNAPGGPTITTNTLMGNIHLLAWGAPATNTASIRTMPAIALPGRRDVEQTSSGGSVPRVFRKGTVKGLLTHSTPLGDVKVTEVIGNADIFTGAGEVQIGSVTGAAQVRSNGGPLHLGEILGLLTASTRAGDILVDSTRRGGTITTEGGTIRLLYTSGPTRLKSGGGDITVRQAAAPVTAETTSGDIAITVDPSSNTQLLDARTGKGNITLTVTPKFRADVEATILTSDPLADTIFSELPGLSISREQVGGRTRVRAVGKINGGGQKVVLQATGGDIRITTGGVTPTLLKRR